MYEIFKCIQEYIDLCQNKYEISIFNGKQIENLKLQFSIQDFLHLSGISKVVSDPIVNKFVNKPENFIDYFINNSQNNNNIFQEEQSLFQRCSKTKISEDRDSSTVYYVSDRIEELTKLCSYISSGKYDVQNPNANVRVYNWKRKASKFERPYESQISADFMINFNRVDVNGNTTGEKVCLFIAKSSEQELCPISLFPVDIPYNDDGKIREKEYEFLYIKESIFSRNDPQKLNPIQTNELFKCSKQRLEQIDDHIKIRQLENELYELKKRRKDVVKSPKPAVEKKYKSKLSFLIGLLQKSEFKPQMIIQVIQSLIDQKADKANEPFVPYIEQEINQVKAVAQQRGINTNVFKAQINPDGSLSVTIPPVSSVMSGLWNDIKSALKSFVTDIKKSFVQADTKFSVSRQNTKSKAPRPSSQARQSPPKPKQDKSDKPKKPPPNMDKNDVQQPKYIGRGTILGNAKIIEQKQKFQDKTNDKTNDIPKKKKNTSL